MRPCAERQLAFENVPSCVRVQTKGHWRKIYICVHIDVEFVVVVEKERRGGSVECPGSIFRRDRDILLFPPTPLSLSSIRLFPNFLPVECLMLPSLSVRVFDGAYETAGRRWSLRLLILVLFLLFTGTRTNPCVVCVFVTLEGGRC